jgi:hypothetical protein
MAWFMNNARLAGLVAFDPEFKTFTRPDGEKGFRMRFLLDFGSKRAEVRKRYPAARRMQVWVKVWGKMAKVLHDKGLCRGDNVYVWGFLEHYLPKGTRVRMHNVVARLVRIVDSDKFRKGHVMIKSAEYHWIKSKLEAIGADLDIPPNVLAQFGLSGEDIGHGDGSDDSEYGDPGDDPGDPFGSPGLDVHD